jgi:CBS domain-containing protein
MFQQQLSQNIGKFSITTVKEVTIMRIAEIMTRDPEVVPSDVFLKDAALRMQQLDVGTLPIRDGDRLVGMLTDRDITVRATAQGRDPTKTQVRDVMTPEVVYCFEDQEVSEATKLMQEKQIRRLPILNQEKRLVGIVSLGDVAVHSGAEKVVSETIKEVSEPAQPKR